MFLIFFMMLIPAAIYIGLPAWWQFVARIGFGSVVLVVGTVFAVRLLREAVLFRHVEAGPAAVFPKVCTWPAGQSAQAFELTLVSYCRGRAWPVQWSKVVDPQRVAVAIRRRGSNIVVLCLSPQAHASDTDAIRVAKWRAQPGVKSVSVVSFGAQPATPSPIDVLPPDALQTMSL
jgi:hypothetical protein